MANLEATVVVVGTSNEEKADIVGGNTHIAIAFMQRITLAENVFIDCVSQIISTLKWDSIFTHFY